MLGPLALALIWWSPWAVVAAVVAIMVIALLELYGAFSRNGYRVHAGLGIALATALAATPLLNRLVAFDLTLPVISLTIMVSLVGTLPYHARKGALAEWALTLSGAIYVAVLGCHLILLRFIETPLSPTPFVSLGMSSGAAWLYLVCLVTWLQDGFAYLVGRSMGRTPMTPHLSPKKTWEGAAGGMAGAIAAGALSVVLFGLPIPIWLGMVLGIVGGIVGPLGDLAESLIKRQVGLKDTGQLIPGHGGILDRVDSLLFTAPVLYYLILLLVR